MTTCFIKCFMKQVFRFSVLLSLAFILLACSSDDSDCTKIITIPQFYIVNNQSYTNNITQEVPCDFPEPTVAEMIQPPELENFNFEVLSFTFTPDTGNNTSRLQFEIQLNNPNSEAVSGIPFLTLNINGIESIRVFSENVNTPCFSISANSNCILAYDEQSSLDQGINSIQLVDVNYYLTN